MQLHSSNTARHRPGYTLVEILVVLAIGALLWGMAAPRYAAALTRYQAEAAARRIAADLLMARSQAMQGGSGVTVSFDASKMNYTISGIRSLDRQAANYSVSLNADPYRITAMTISSFSSNQVTFSVYGSADRSGTISVTAGGVQWNVAVEATAGKVTVSAQ